MLVLELALVPVLVIFMPLHGPSHRRPNQHSRDSIGTSLTAPEDDDKDDVSDADGDDEDVGDDDDDDDDDEDDDDVGDDKEERR